MVVSDWCITNLAHGWWVSIQTISKKKNFSSLFILTENVKSGVLANYTQYNSKSLLNILLTVF